MTSGVSPPSLQEINGSPQAWGPPYASVVQRRHCDGIGYPCASPPLQKGKHSFAMAGGSCREESRVSSVCIGLDVGPVNKDIDCIRLVVSGSHAERRLSSVHFYPRVEGWL